jgi:hypothetical protein
MTDPMMSDAPTSTTPAKSAAWEDVLDIFYAPRAVFERRRDGKYLIPILVLCVMSMLVFLLSSQVNEALQDAEFARVMKQNKLTPEQAASGKAIAAKFASLAIYIIPVFVAIGAWISGLIILLLGNAMGGKLNFAQATTIAVFSSMPELIGRVLVGVQGLLLDTSAVVHKYSFSINASRFLPADASNWLLKAGALLDPFVLWGIFLIGMGAWIIGRMEKEKAAVLAIVVALVGAALFR